MLDGMDSHSIYIHIPFCRQRCLYCDFNTYAGRSTDIPAYVEALCREISGVAGSANEPVPVHTVYFGGGTPSLLTPEHFQKILETLQGCFKTEGLKEISLEANPGTVDRPYLSRLRELGVNRLSLGAQSALPHELALLGRIHTLAGIRQAVEDARQAGFDNLNLDFMYGLPGQKNRDWQASLDLAIQLYPEHLSCYALTLEENTPLARRIAEGDLAEVDDDQAADCYEMAMDQLASAGYEQYEISNWALPRNGDLLSCNHNLQYWHNDPYLGFGAGAHSYSQGTRTANVCEIDAYIAQLQAGTPQPFPLSPANDTRLAIDEVARLQEGLMVGLRLTKEGIARSHYIDKYQIDIYLKYTGQIDRLVQSGLLEWVGGEKEQLRLTRRGRLLGNQVFMQFVGD
jgi:oxygen-independent coproporphyrinogen-3 oxidase